MKRTIGKRGPSNETRGNIVNILAEGGKTVKEITEILTEKLGVSEERTVRSHLTKLIENGIIGSDAEVKDNYNRTRSQSKKVIHYKLPIGEVMYLPKLFGYMENIGGYILRDFMISPWYRTLSVTYALKFSEAAKFISSEDFFPDVSIQTILSEEREELEYDDIPVFPDAMAAHLDDLLESTADPKIKEFLKEKMSELKRPLENLENFISERTELSTKVKEKWEKSSKAALEDALGLGFSRKVPEDVIAGLLSVINEDQRGSVIARIILSFPDSAKIFFEWVLNEEPNNDPINGKCDDILSHFIQILRTKRNKIKKEGENALQSGNYDDIAQFKFFGSSYLAIKEIIVNLLSNIDFTDSIFQMGMLENYLVERTNDRQLKRVLYKTVFGENQP